MTREQGRKDAHIWSDYINVGMEHGAFDMTGLAEYMQGLVEGGPTNSGHRAATVIVEAPVNGIDEDYIRYNAWQFRQLLGRGVHGILLCQVETAGAAPTTRRPAPPRSRAFTCMRPSVRVSSARTA